MMIIGAALAGSADSIVTGDRDLLVVGNYGPVSIIAPADFASFEQSHQSG